MGLRGPAPKPTALKLLEGTFRADRAPANEPTPDAATPDMPAWVKRDADARKEWSRIVPVLAKLGVLTALDGGVLEGYIASHARAVKAERALKRKGLIVQTPFGPKTNPAIKIAKDAWAEVRQASHALGLNPAARSRISVPKAPDAPDAKRNFLLGRKGTA